MHHSIWMAFIKKLMCFFFSSATFSTGQIQTVPRGSSQRPSQRAAEEEEESGSSQHQDSPPNRSEGTTSFINKIVVFSGTLEERYFSPSVQMCWWLLRIWIPHPIYTLNMTKQSFPCAFGTCVKHSKPGKYWNHRVAAAVTVWSNDCSGLWVVGLIQHFNMCFVFYWNTLNKHAANVLLNVSNTKHF